MPSSLSEVTAFLFVGSGARKDQKTVPSTTAGDTRPQDVEILQSVQAGAEAQEPVSCPSKPPGGLNGQDSLGPVLASIF